MSEGLWERVSLRDLGTGQRPAVKAGPFGSALKKSYYVDYGYRIYGQEQVIGGDLKKGDYYIDEERFQNLRSCEVKAGDVLLSLVGTVGRALVVPQDHEPGIINPRLLRLSLDPTRVNPAFLCHWLRSPIIQSILTQHAQGGTMGVLNARIVKDLKLHVPPLLEQRKIAAILSSVDDTIEKTEAVIEQLQVVKKAMMQELLTRGLPGRHTRFKKTEIGEVPSEWEVVELGDLSIHVTSGSRGWAKYYADDGAFFFRISNVKRNATRVDLSDMKHVRLPVSGSEGQRTRVVPGDILISITADLGLVGLIPNDWNVEAYVNQHLALVRINSEKGVVPAFVAWFLAGSPGRAQFQLLNDGGAKAGMNLRSIRKVAVPVPPADEQNEITMALDNLESCIAHERAVVSELQQMKSALMSVLLTGEVRVIPDEAHP